MPDAIIFDLFETLVSEFDPAEAAPNPAKRLGLDEQGFRQEWRKHQRARMLGQVDYASVLADICRSLGVEPQEGAIQRIEVERRARFARTLRGVDREVLDALCGLRDGGFKIGLISNSTPEETAAWAESPLSPFFDDVIFSHEVGLLKPDPAVYVLACRRLEAQPERSVYVGDGGRTNCAEQGWRGCMLIAHSGF